MSVTVRISGPVALGVSPNERVHWGERKRRNGAARAAACVAAMRVRPSRPIGPAVLDVRVTWPKGARMRDEDNLRGMLKPVQDGLVEAGIIASDAPAHLRLRSLRQDRDRSLPWAVIEATVTEET